MSSWTKALAIGKPDTIGTMIYGPHSASVAWCGCGSAYDSDGSYSISPAEAHANAKLYAAAPELVDALIEMVEANNGVAVMPTAEARRQNNAIAQARAALAKAGA